MIEIFENIPNFVKEQIEFWFNLSLQQKDAIQMLKMLEEYRNSCYSEEEKNFVDFYINQRLTKILENYETKEKNDATTRT